LISDSDHVDTPLASNKLKGSEGSIGDGTPTPKKEKKKRRRKSTFVVKPIPEGDDDLRLMRENLMGIYKCCDDLEPLAEESRDFSPEPMPKAKKEKESKSKKEKKSKKEFCDRNDDENELIGFDQNHMDLIGESLKDIYNFCEDLEGPLDEEPQPKKKKTKRKKTLDPSQEPPVVLQPEPENPWMNPREEFLENPQMELQISNFLLPPITQSVG
jgi:hypothetical protein